MVDLRGRGTSQRGENYLSQGPAASSPATLQGRIAPIVNWLP